MCTNAWQHRVILVTSTHGKANGHKRPGFTNQQTVIITCNHHPKPNVHTSAAAKRLCMHMQASKQNCLAAMETQQTTMRAWARQAHKPTDDQTFGSASRQVVLAAQPTPKGSPKMLGQFPCDQRGRQRRALGQNHAAAPQRRPRAREPFFSLKRSVTAHKRLV